MTTTPTKADAAAAERLLKKAVKRAQEVLAGPARMRFGPSVPTSANYGPFPVAASSTNITAALVQPCADDVVAILTAAGESAALLLGETP